ncbi:S41 family peptidase [Kutzneria sp. 744]|uniref:S41 family peptidase n=1 Tax=Kutzneria sp. (strain 744) TaxID=345341 RepID=UPI0003EEC48F|nr:S41 family peptidase [Kutzneria sp. 744]EWM18210.1 tricorn protease [Kutzneria sp. 744]
MTGYLPGYMRWPTIAGDTVVFACEDDLWSVPVVGGSARRLTAGVSEASRPRLSPDGSLVAFVGSDDGPSELYVMPAVGGPSRRLTYQAARCVTVGWHPSTGEIIYASAAEQPAGFGFRLFTVSPNGGLPRLLRPGLADAIAFGPDGRVVLGRNTADPARWKRYRGGLAGELWTSSTVDGPLTPLLSLPGNLANPCWVGDRIFFISDHEGVGNVYSCRPDGADLHRHTEHQEYYARNLSSDGRRLVHHAGAELFLLDEHLPVEVAGSRSQCARRIVSAADHLEDARLSPDGKSVALTVRGKAFTLNPVSGPVRQHGNADGVRYRLLDWLSDGRLVAVAGDAEPEERLVFLGPEETTVPTGSVGTITELATHGDRVAFATNRQQLWVVDNGCCRLLDHSPHERIEDLAWSPDGRWLAYTYPLSPRTSAIKVAEPASGRTFQATEPVLRDSRPAFDPGGRYLYFVGQRDLVVDHDQVQFDLGFPYAGRPYLITLCSEEPPPFEHSTPDPVAEVEIDFGGIDRRVLPLPVPEGRYLKIIGLPGKVLLHSAPLAAPDVAEPEATPDGIVTVVDLVTGEVEEEVLSPVDELSVSEETVLYRHSSSLRTVKVEDIADEDEPDEIDLARLKVAVQPESEWRQMFRETWRLQREGFWDAAMNGVAWDAMHDRYARLLPRVGTRAELSDLLWEVQAELGTSHTYERGGEYRPTPQHGQGFLGVDWDSGWCIGNILRGDPWNPRLTSPCNRLGADIRTGDQLVAINGRPVSSPGELLVGQADRQVELTLVRDGVSRDVTVTALADESAARYRDWVSANRAAVKELSGGRLGYVHVPDMNAGGYAEFVRGFLTELDCEGLIVDVRFNGGGQIAPLLLDRLSRRRFGTETGRWSSTTPYPGEAPRGPMALLVNEHTGSNGEIFAQGFRSLGLGPIVGRRTWGGVIATWPRHGLVDGTVTTQPEFRYVLDGQILENRGVRPDVQIDDEDRQLAAAVEQLLPVPAP